MTVIADIPITLASLDECAQIASMSRDYIEQGLGWSWRPARVAAAIKDRETNVAVLRARGGLAAFGIMSYHREHAHLQLLAVRRAYRRSGCGSAILLWLEHVAEVAGLVEIRVEARNDNPAALAFYRKHGYRKIADVPAMYRGTHDGIRLVKSYWTTGSNDSAANRSG
jgi:ribosomal protein S18 acetylase RimI-like enzyme